MAQEGTITPEDIFGINGPVSSEKPDSNPILVGRKVSEVERELILHTLDHCLGNRTHAANILGISIRTLRNKLKEYSDSNVSSTYL
jgi:DNA-binding NtrC family response regulator